MSGYLIESQVIFVPFLTDLLARVGIHIVYTRSEVDLPHIAQIGPELIFLDLDSIGYDGLDALRVIHVLVPNTTIFVYTNFEDTERSITLREAGADYVIPKSAGESTIIQMLREALTRTKINTNP